MVTWTRDGDNISSLEDSHLYTPSQLVVPRNGLYRSGDYSNILTVSGRLPGVYGVSVTNDRTTTPVTPTNNFTIIGNYCMYQLHALFWEDVSMPSIKTQINLMHTCRFCSFKYFSKCGTLSRANKHKCFMDLGQLIIYGVLHII